jgi:membrane protein DedA with SNARE-associated domain
MIDWATEVIDSIGLVGVAMLVALESVVPPIPSELVLLLAGFNVDQGNFTFVGAVVAATVGSVVGALILYALGALLSEERLMWLLQKVGRFVGFTKKDIDRGFQWFERHGAPVVFFGRLIPLVRSVVSIPAGAARMPLGKFVIWTALGSAVWNVVWVAIGQVLGEQWEKAEEWAGTFQYVAVALFAIVGLGVIVHNLRRRKFPR